jgi:hypothetical protein
MSAEEYCWTLVNDFIDNFNEYRNETFDAGPHVEVDESIIRWYGVGGEWINKGSPHYVAMERKPDNGIEVQNVADVTTGIMLQLKLVKSANNESRIDKEQFDEDELQLGKGTRVLLEFLKPLFNTERLVTADSYYASVEAVTTLSAKGLKFIGNVKTSSSGFPKTSMNYTCIIEGITLYWYQLTKKQARPNLWQWHFWITTGECLSELRLELTKVTLSNANKIVRTISHTTLLQIRL